MNKPTPTVSALPWPDGYRAWTGSFAELVATASQILATHAP